MILHPSWVHSWIKAVAPLAAAWMAAASSLSGTQDAATALPSARDISADRDRKSHLDPWSLQAGVAVITANTIDDLMKGSMTRAQGPSRGEIYLFGVSYTLRDLEIGVAGRTFHPQLELPVVIGVVDERGRSRFMDYNAGLTLRWTQFPWNEVLHTNVESGVGLSYTDKVLLIERERHPTRERSHLKFYWPIEVAFALPNYRQHQAVLFIHHQSGGHIFDRGGSNHLGVAYRHVFRER
jgi:hypothetical protein